MRVVGPQVLLAFSMLSSGAMIRGFARSSCLARSGRRSMSHAFGPRGLRFRALSGGALVGAAAALHAGSTASNERVGALGAPVAEKKPHEVWFGAPLEGAKGADLNKGEGAMAQRKVLTDPYYWLRDDAREDPKILGHLRAENAFSEGATAHLAELRSELYEEMLSHIKETDSSAGYDSGPYTYYSRTVEGKGYTIHCRRPRGAPESAEAETVLLDENEVAARNTESSQTNVGDVEESPSHRLLAYTVDTSGYETYELRFVDLETGEELPDVIKDVDSGVEWSRDDSHIYYRKMDAQHRPHQVWRHRLGAPASQDELLFQEDDELFWVSLEKTLDSEYILINSASTETSEVLQVKLSDARPTAAPVAPRRPGVLYGVDHRRGTFYIVTNEGGHKNFRLLTAPADAPQPENWTPMLDAGGAGVLDDGSDMSPGARTLSSVACFDGFLAASGRAGGYSRVWVLPIAGGKGSAANTAEEMVEVAPPESAGSLSLGSNAEFSADALRLGYTSMVTPDAVLDYAVASGELSTVKETEVPGYEKGLYATEVLHAESFDGQRVPVTLLYRRDRRRAGEPMPLHLYGYGSYGICCDPDFRASRLALLDRGVAFAVAHVRGGGEMGRCWYEQMGKYLSKRNTFLDFVSCAEHLHAAGWGGPRRTSIEGRSAGGLLVGAVLNMRPDLFQAAVAGVPFVDCMVTMRDASIPLTVGEWEEWGNPNVAKYFHYMKSYSPMENVDRQHYPHVLATAGLHDPRVAYWEPAKWVQKLRENNLADTDVLLKMDMEAGHFSASDRYKYLRELSFDYAFVLDKLGLVPAED